MCTAGSAQTLEDAYTRELSRLNMEKQTLRRALKKAKARGKTSRAALTSDMEALTRKLTILRADNMKEELRVPQAVRMQSMQDQERRIEQRKAQIETWLETHKVALPKATHLPDNSAMGHQHPPLDAMVVAALKHVKEHGRLWRRNNQEYFGEDGHARRGSVLRIAEIGAIAIDEGYRPLELSPDGSLRLTDIFSPASIAHGESRTVGVVLFDPSDIRPATAEDTCWQGWIEKGGVVMYAIAALAILACVVFIERILIYCLYVFRVRACEKKEATREAYAGHPLLKAVEIIRSGQGTAEELETRAAEALQGGQAVIRRGVSLLAVIASVAPLLGLLGTVTGMIGTFGMITLHGTGDPRLLSGGISEALLTTQFGLMVAIPALVFQAILYRFGDVILRRVERLALETLQLREQVSGTGPEIPLETESPIQSVS